MADPLSIIAMLIALLTGGGDTAETPEVKAPDKTAVLTQPAVEAPVVTALPVIVPAVGCAFETTADRKVIAYVTATEAIKGKYQLKVEADKLKVNDSNEFSVAAGQKLPLAGFRLNLPSAKGRLTLTVRGKETTCDL